MENKDTLKNVIETQDSEKATIIIEEVDNEDDNAFLKSLENIVEENADDEEKKKENEEALKIKNKNAEEARKRREAEAKAKADADLKAKEEADKLAKEKEEREQVKPQEPQEQVKELVKKYPELDLGELDRNEDFQEYLQGKWVKGGKTITEIYESFVNYTARLSKQDKADIEKQYQKKPTPSIKSNSGGNGGKDKAEDVYTLEEVKALGERMPYMTSKEYDQIEAKFDRSVNFYKKNKKT